MRKTRDLKRDSEHILLYSAQDCSVSHWVSSGAKGRDLLSLQDSSKKFCWQSLSGSWHPPWLSLPFSLTDLWASQEFFVRVWNTELHTSTHICVHMCAHTCSLRQAIHFDHKMEILECLESEKSEAVPRTVTLLSVLVISLNPTSFLHLLNRTILGASEHY